MTMMMMMVITITMSDASEERGNEEEKAF